MSFLSDIGDQLTQALTGSTTSQLAADADAAEQQIAIAVSTMIALEAIIVTELLLLIIMAWKERH
jgi:hypothetical protein